MPLSTNFKFRELTAGDFPVMLAWLSKSHVRQWWDDGDDTLEKVSRHYGPENDAKMFILIEIGPSGEKPVGYFQYYFAGDDVIGIDQFIGEEDYLDRGVGQKTIRMFVEMIRRRHDPAAVILDPAPENKRAVRCYEKAGFRHVETFIEDDGTPVYLMRLDCR